jgi:hypothetical protein
MANVPTPEDWRALVGRIQEEKDPEKMIELVQKLIQSLDTEKQPLDNAAQSSQQSSPRSSQSLESSAPSVADRDQEDGSQTR